METLKFFIDFLNYFNFLYFYLGTYLNCSRERSGRDFKRLSKMRNYFFEILL